MNRFAGIDIGSRTIELVVIDADGVIQESLQADTGFDPMTAARAMIERVDFDQIMATGYGRTLFEISFAARTVTEIKAHARGARASFAEAQTVLDIGGQDSKSIALMDNGRVKKFEMNDRCAAGTGKFLEIMAKSLGFSIDDFGREALLATSGLTISSMCTVFAESEVTSLIAKGEHPRDIALGLHQSVIRRAAAMVNRVSSDGTIVFTGGVARNPCMVELLNKHLGRTVVVPGNPQQTGALGAALILLEEH
ncbi:acyl-CoA dehydratase activase [Desulfofustis limnaeus]|jgi:predicted CoA-substrate-specific enzyme activase|uniref:3-hydroxyacyl-ACP dehydratase n=1 Tax=Desulfofustis limnaeus TaxID=2740163 RepID=A0ABN6M8Q0_9BACT|nr:acyl-CoA dehydratase activase [Desulfofustis limnaeus]MDX9895583.1 acyl-CoA dehydratase activase [Desulfofustis sp.]BDD88419.1 3-hydroxyacyl-ACP dehydratase [Desulfofustis limnaeus]